MLSDEILFFMVKDIEILNKIQTFKGSFFIIVTSIFLYHLCSALSLMKCSVKESNEKIKETKSLLNKTIARNKAQSQFFINLSHDLKTPINLIFTSIQMVELHWHNTVQYPNKYINIMRQNCYRLIKLINNIVDITKFDSGFCDIKLKELS